MCREIRKNIEQVAEGRHALLHFQTWTVKVPLRSATLRANLADGRLMMFFLLFPRKIGFDISCKLSLAKETIVFPENSL